MKIKQGAVIERCQIRSGQNSKIGGRKVPQLLPTLKESVPRGGSREGGGVHGGQDPPFFGAPQISKRGEKTVVRVRAKYTAF